MSERGPAKQAPPKRGDVQTDPDGSRWIVTKVEHDGPKTACARVRDGSLAPQPTRPLPLSPKNTYTLAAMGTILSFDRRRGST